MKRILLAGVVVAVGVGGIALGLRMRGLSFREAAEMSRDVVKARTTRRTTEGVVAEVEKAKPALALLAKAAGSKLRINVFKEERTVEISSPGWDKPIVYKMTAFSGKLGPKLKEGDRQIPEGIYCVEYMNPNSSFHLSFKVSYPNEFDKAMAAKEGRTNLGGDIMIHGSNATVGCVPIGNEAIEDVFYLVAKVGFKNVEIVIAPYDMRKGRRPELEESSLAWYPRLCDDICAALNKGPLGNTKITDRTENWLRTTSLPKPSLYAPTTMGEFVEYLEQASRDFAEPLSPIACHGISFHCDDGAAKKAFCPRPERTATPIPDGGCCESVTFWDALINACEQTGCTVEIVSGTVWIESKSAPIDYDAARKLVE